MRLLLTLCFAGLALSCSGLTSSAEHTPRRRPNVIFIMADDLGYGELGCYGQEKIRTPHIDALAAGGMRFTQAYSGAPVCAPARCVLMTGSHSARAEVRGNKEVKPEGQHPLSAEVPTVAQLMRDAGYATGAMGKWGLGPVGSSGDPNAKGFDLFVGYNCQREAHSYYPDHIWRNDERVELNGGVRIPGHAKLAEGEDDFAQFIGEDYAPDPMLAEALGFIREHADEPFFLYLPFVEPHLAMQPPAEWLERYPIEWDEEPYLGQRGYTPHPRPRAGYAAMISDLDEHVGAVVGLVDELGLAEDTLIVFTSDNGATHDVGGVDTTFFESVGPLRGRKGSVYEGGIRVPMIARWPGTVAAGTTTDHQTSFQDLMATMAGLTGREAPGSCDGISYLPTITGNGDQETHEYLVWEFYGYQGQKAVRMGDWKAVQREIHKGNTEIQLYDLAMDIAEQHDLAAAHPELVARAREIFATDRTPNPNFPMQAYDPPPPNVLLLLADDQGYADLGFLGLKDEVHTPNLDRLAASGLYLPNAYASSPICNPSRVGLLTGRYQQRWKNFFYGGGRGLPPEATTIAERLQEAGYSTGYFGKVHTGGPDREPEAYGFPLNQGFDRFYGTTTGGRVHYLRHGPEAQAEFGEAAGQMAVGPLWDDTDSIDFDGFTTEAFGAQARAFVAENQARPFFALVAFNAVHNFAWQLPDAELEARGLEEFPDWNPESAKYMAWYEGVHRRDWPEGRAYYLAQLECMDREVGRMLDQLDELGLTENTLVVYTVDNGGCVPDWADNGPLAGSKYHLLEGGTRTPTLLSMPGTLPAGEVHAELFSALDLAPTICELAGIEVPATEFDGADQLAVLRGEAAASPRDLHWDIGWQWSVRSGDWKLMQTEDEDFARREADFEQVGVRTGTHLYDLGRDPGETENLAGARPELVAHLRTEHLAWREAVGQPVSAE